MTICFLTISSMTPLYHAIALRLERRGFRVAWISPSARWTTWLVDRGVNRSNVLDMTQFAHEWTAARADPAELEAFERVSSKSTRDLILMDRLLSEGSPDVAIAYASSCVRHVKAFLDERRPSAVFAEPSYLLAYIVAEVCEANGIPNYNFDSVRFPEGRFGFFRGIYQSHLVGAQEVGPDALEIAAHYHQRFIEIQERPSYFAPNVRAPTLSPSLAWKLARNIIRRHEDPHDHTGFPVGRMVGDHVRKTWNHARVSRWSGLYRPDGPGSRPYVLYGLHKQPELGIDVWASYLSNQEELVRSIARSIPISHDLLVKAHSNDLGGRSRSFFQKLARIPGVKIVDPLADSHALIRSADLVLSVTGSMAFEAGLYGRRSVSFAPMFFAPLLAASGVNPYSMRLADYRTLLSRPHPSDDPSALSPVSFLASVLANSFPGFLGDPIIDHRIMEPGNLDLVALGFDVLLRSAAQPT